MRQHFNINTIKVLLKPDDSQMFKEKVAELSRLSPNRRGPCDTPGHSKTSIRRIRTGKRNEAQKQGQTK